MKIKQKILLLIVFLIALVSNAIIYTTVKLSEEGQQEVFDGVSSKLRELHHISTSELEMAKEIADKGIADASGLVAIDQVTRITLANQKDFYSKVNKEIDLASGNIAETLSAQNQAIIDSLDLLLSEGTESVSRIMELDSSSLAVIAKVSISNVDYLQQASHEGLERFKDEKEKFVLHLAKLEEVNNSDIDKIIANTLVAWEDQNIGSTERFNSLLIRLNELKGLAAKRQHDFFTLIFQAEDQQERILSEVIRLAANEVRWAINRELESSAEVQAYQIEGVIEHLVLAQTDIRTKIDRSTTDVQTTIDLLKNNLPLDLRKRGERTNRIINDQINETRKDTAMAQLLVGKRIEANTKKALEVFESAIGESQVVIEKSMQSSLKKSTQLSFFIAAICAVFAVIVGFMMVRSLTKPITRVLYFADKLSKGDLSERLREGPDEMGEMSKALNRMADELVQLQEATINSFNQTLDQVIDCVFMFDPDSLKFIYANQGAIDHLGYNRDELFSMTPVDIKPEFTDEPFRNMINALQNSSEESLTFTTLHRSKSGEDIPVEILLKYAVPPGNDPRFVAIVRDISERLRQRSEKEKIQSELLHKQKLESVGQLAAGIAHEINTPTQFIGTNIEFLADAYTDVEKFFTWLQDNSSHWPVEIKKVLDESIRDLDWNYLQSEIPLAIEESRDGVDRVSSLVSAMKRFSHPGTKEITYADLSEIIDTSLTVSRNEWKYIAEVKKEYDSDLPKIPLLIDQMGQVILNMIVNSAQAIKEKHEKHGTEERGVITITTKMVDDEVELRFSDTGSGIPENIIKKVFDPFFTTKQVGNGTGQGLAICHDVITQKLHGSMSVSSQEDVGTSFIIRLPSVSTETEN